jgi:hypothetical protein
MTGGRPATGPARPTPRFGPRLDYLTAKTANSAGMKAFKSLCSLRSWRLISARVFIRVGLVLAAVKI